MKLRNKTKEQVFSIVTYLSAILSVFVLGAIIVFVLINGYKTLSINFIFGKHYEENYLLMTDELNSSLLFENNLQSHFSKKLGIGFKETLNKNDEIIIEITYIDKNSPLSKMNNYNDEIIALEKNMYLDTYLEYTDANGEINYFFVYEGVEELINVLDSSSKINALYLNKGGGGILGSIITTILLVILTLLIGFPLGIVTALYLHELAPQNKVIDILRSMIDLLTGIPSIIYGLIGATLLIPVSQKILNDPSALGGNILAGALTLSIMVLPVVIKTTEQSLSTIPKSYKQASLALGATEVQTTFKLILPNAISGILQAALLTIGRVIGESAALIYVIGTVINDQIKIGGKGTSLAVHIWTVMAGESPNLGVASAIAIIILVIVLSLNIAIKLITNKIDKKIRG